MIAGRDFGCVEVQKNVAPADCVAVLGNHPAYILYTSGTTGALKW
jgi:propionyl-CoA synthetase